MLRISFSPGSRAFPVLPLLVLTAIIATGCSDEDGRPFGNLKIMTAPDGGQTPSESGSGGAGALGVAGHGGPAVSAGTGNTAGAAVKGTGGGGGPGGAGIVPGTGGGRPPGSGGAGAVGGSGGASGSGGIPMTSGSGGGSTSNGSGGTAAGGGGVKGTGGAPASSGGALGSGGRPASTGGSPGLGGSTPPASTGGTTPPIGSGGAGGSGAGGKSGGGMGGGTGRDDCDQLIKDYDAALPDAKACKAGDMKACQSSVPAKLAGCGSECTTFVQKSGELEAIRNKWTKAGCSAPACLVSLCVLNPTSATCDSSGMCTDDVL